MRIGWVSFDVIGRSCLEEACSIPGAQIVAVVTLPGPIDPARSGQCRFDDVAARIGAQLIETNNVNSEECLEQLGRVKPEMIFVIGWSQLVREPFISLAPHGVFGMHPSLLPRHRGRAPIPWAILSGLARTGVTLFDIVDPTADTGNIVGQVEVPIDADETASTLFQKIEQAHLELIRTYVPALLEWRAPRIPQDARRASAWPKRTPGDGIIDWETRAPYLDDWIRAQTRPYPGAFTYLGGRKLIVWRAAPLQAGGDAQAGTVLEARADGVVVACGTGTLLLQEVEPEGSGSCSGADIGDVVPVGTRLG